MRFFEWKVWQKSVDLTTDIYRVTADFPKAETYGLQAQMRRAAISIASNIAEGEGRSSRNERRQFYSLARGSLFELKTQILIGERLKLLDERSASSLQEKADEIGRMLTGSIRKDEKEPVTGNR